jgi:hypothetical protein
MDDAGRLGRNIPAEDRYLVGFCWVGVGFQQSRLSVPETLDVGGIAAANALPV